MFRYKTSASKDLFHIVLMDIMPYIQGHYAHTKSIDPTAIIKTYKTLLGAQKALKEGYAIVWEKGMN